MTFRCLFVLEPMTTNYIRLSLLIPLDVSIVYNLVGSPHP